MKIPGLRRFPTDAIVSYSRPGRNSLYHARTLQTAERWNGADSAYGTTDVIASRTRRQYRSMIRESGAVPPIRYRLAAVAAVLAGLRGCTLPFP